MRQVLVGVVGVTALAVSALFACSSSKDHSFDPNNPGDGSSGAGASSGTPPGTIGSSGGSSSGTGTTTCAADVVTAKRAEVDIIVVIDTSGSMSEETKSVNDNINKFATSIGASGLDYRVIMIADKPPAFLPPGFPIPGVCVPPPLGGAACGDSNPPSFHHIVTTVDSNNSLQLILDQYPTYAPWLRDTAFKVFIEVTDDNSTPMAWSAFDTQLLAKSATQFGTSTARRYIFDSICGWKKSTAVLSATKCDTAENIGDQYQNLSQLTGGIVDSVCETDYTGVFDNIAKGLVTKLGCEFAVPKPKDGSPADPTKVVVNYTAAGGTPTPLTQVTDASKCGAIADAWYYDNPTTPTKILFCPTTCTGVGSDTNGKVEIAIGCLAPVPK